MQAGQYHVFENHYNYKFLNDGPTKPYKGLEFHLIRLNGGDTVPESGPPLALVSGCRETYAVTDKLTDGDDKEQIQDYKKSDGSSYTAEEVEKHPMLQNGADFCLEFRAFCEDPVCEPGKTILYKHECVEYSAIFTESLTVKFELNRPIQPSMLQKSPVRAQIFKTEKTNVFINFTREIGKCKFKIEKTLIFLLEVLVKNPLNPLKFPRNFFRIKIRQMEWKG